MLGFSDGGNIALIFALKYPGYVDRLILNGANLNPFGMRLSVLADVAQEYLGVEGKLWLQKSGIGQGREKMQMAAGKMRTEKQFSKENEKKNGQEGRNKQQRRSCQKEKIHGKRENDWDANIHKKELLSLMLYEPWIRPELLRRLFRVQVFVVIGPYASDGKIQAVSLDLLVNGHPKIMDLCRTFFGKPRTLGNGNISSRLQIFAPLVQSPLKTDIINSTFRPDQV